MTEANDGTGGWRIQHPEYLNEPPKDRRDLMEPDPTVTHTDPVQGMFATEEEARRELIRLSRGLRARALSEEHRCADKTNELRDWQREERLKKAERQRAIAEAALTLLGVPTNDWEGIEIRERE